MFVVLLSQSLMAGIPTLLVGTLEPAPVVAPVVEPSSTVGEPDQPVSETEAGPATRASPDTSETPATTSTTETSARSDGEASDGATEASVKEAGPEDEPPQLEGKEVSDKAASDKAASDKVASDEDTSDEEEMSDEDMEDMDMSEEGGHHAMAHPFYVHMGLPDGPGEANIRVFGIGRLSNGGNFGPDGGFHIEAGLIPRLGIHIRNDAIWRTGMGEATDEERVDSGDGPPPASEREGGESSHTEVMAMVSILQNDAGTRGLSLFGQIAFPTVRTGDELPVAAAFGPSGRIMVKDRFVFDANVHFAASSKKFAAEYEAGAMVRVVSQLFVMVENRGEAKTKSFESFVLPGVKYRFGSISVGLAAQVPVTPGPLYRVQGMFQLDVGFM